MKICKSCARELPLDGFYRNKGRVMGKCKACHCAGVRRHRAMSDNARAYDRGRAATPERKRHAREITIKWRRENPEKYRAQTLVGNALRDGRLLKEPCLLCGSPYVHAHHEDYSQPLNVIWLCPRHHHLGHSVLSRGVPAKEIDPELFKAGTTVPQKHRVKRMENR